MGAQLVQRGELGLAGIGEWSRHLGGVAGVAIGVEVEDERGEGRFPPGASEALGCPGGEQACPDNSYSRSYRGYSWS